METIDASFTYVGTWSFQFGGEGIGPIERQIPSNPQLNAARVVMQPNTAFLAANVKEISAKYAGKWILVAGGKIVASANSPAKLEKQAAKSGIEDPLIAEIGKGPAVWNTAYASQVI